MTNDGNEGVDLMGATSLRDANGSFIATLRNVHVLKVGEASLLVGRSSVHLRHVVTISMGFANGWSLQ